MKSEGCGEGIRSEGWGGRKEVLGEEELFELLGLGEEDVSGEDVGVDETILVMGEE